MKDKKAAKKLIKLAKEHPEWYSKHDVYFAKMVKKRIKLEKQLEKIGDRLKLVLEESKKSGESTDSVVRRIAWKRINSFETN